jgi:ribosomal-protein-alanine N-acetyltransferase
MTKTITKTMTETIPLFETQHLLIKPAMALDNRLTGHLTAKAHGILLESTLTILTPKSAQYLPPQWGGLDNTDTARLWWHERIQDGGFYLVSLKGAPDYAPIGFLFLFEAEVNHQATGLLAHDPVNNELAASDPIANGAVTISLHLGYVLRQSVWGQGYGQELINGLINWSRLTGRIATLYGGVATANKASLALLNKNGFTLSSEDKATGVIMMQYCLHPTKS